jgi:thiamine-monophosphate kinase
MEQQRTELSEMGEFGLINHLTKNIELKQASSVLGVGDDAAVIDHYGRQTVISTDLLIEGVHFDLMYTPLKHLGFKAITVNVSDIYAMNAIPTQVTVSVAITNRFSVEAISEFYEGVYAACNYYQVDLIGGDTTSSTKGFCISVTAIGEVAPGKFVTRSGAQVNDLVCVSGQLGGAYLGLTLLEREKKIFLENPQLQPDLENEKYIVEKILMPKARKEIIEFFTENDIIPSAMMDISDGLSSEILHICKQSNCGAMLYEDKLPIADESRTAAMKFNLDPTVCALNGGEDYELLFTIKQSDYDKIKDSFAITIIGYIAESSEGVKLTSRGGNVFPITAQGWNSL